MKTQLKQMERRTMTDDFLTVATDTTDTIKTLLQKAELLKAYSDAFERGETATLTLRFGDATIKPGTYLLVEHADNSLPTSPMQFGYIYQMFHYGADGVMMTGIKP